jgi:glycosyltransferase involved in cell wall biosynthesis
LIANSEAARRRALARGVPAGRVCVGPNVIEADPEVTARRLDPAPPRNGTVVLALARLAATKRLDYFLAAVAKARAEVPSLRAVIAGEGPERAALEGLARELGLGESVRFPGRAGDVDALLRQAEALVHPARWEGFGLVLLEAMLAARPVVGTRVSAIPEIVADGETGLLVPADDPGALADALGRVLAEPTLARQLGEAGLARPSASGNKRVQRVCRHSGR